MNALNRRFHFNSDRSKKKLLTLNWVSESCTWRVYILKLEDSDNYQIWSATLDHTCIVKERSNYHKAATTRVIWSIIKSKYEGNTRGRRAIDLQRLLLTDYFVRISIGRHKNPAKLQWREPKDQLRIASTGGKPMIYCWF